MGIPDGVFVDRGPWSVTLVAGADGPADGCEKDPPVKGLAEESVVSQDGSPLPVGDLAVAAGDEYDRQFRSPCPGETLQLKAVELRHANIGNQAVDCRKGVIVEKRLARAEGEHGMARRFQEILE